MYISTQTNVVSENIPFGTKALLIFHFFAKFQHFLALIVPLLNIVKAVREIF